MASHCQISTIAFADRAAGRVEDAAGQVGDLADGRGDAVVDDDQVVVGVERQLVRVERPLGHAAGSGQLLGEQAAGARARRAARHAAAGARPLSCGRAVSAAQVAPWRFPPALCGEDVAAPCGAACSGRQWLRVRRGDEGRGRSRWCAWSSRRQVHQHQPGEEVDRHRPRLHRGRAHVRRRQPRRGAQVRGPARRHRGPGAAGVPKSVGEIGFVDEVRRRPGRGGTRRQARDGHRGPLRRLQLPRRKPGVDASSRTAKRSAGTLDLITHIDETLGVPTRIIDIGGGFPVSYREPMPAIDAVAAAVDEVLGDRRDEFTLLAEPGRFLAADCMTLLTSVVGSAVRDGAGVALPRRRSLRQLLERDDRGRPPADPRDAASSSTARACLEPVTLAGPTCDSADVIARDYPMPALSLGDVVVSPMMGAYTSVTSSRFNGIPATPIIEV